MNQHLTLDDLLSFDPGSQPRALWRRFLCPTCGLDKPRDESHRSLVTTGGYFKCHRCGWQGRFGGDTKIAYDPEELNRIRIVQEADKEARRNKAFNYWECLIRTEPPTPAAQFLYLVNRGIKPETFKDLDVRASHFSNSVVFGGYDCCDDFQGCQERYVKDNAGPKTRSHGPISEGVFWAFKNEWQHHKPETLVVVEAPIDALSLRQMGHNAIAVFGCNIPSWLPSVAKRRGWNMLCGSDNDSAGEDAARKWQFAFKDKDVLTGRLRPAIGFNDWNDVLRYGKPTDHPTPHQTTALAT